MATENFFSCVDIEERRNGEREERGRRGREKSGDWSSREERLPTTASGFRVALRRATSSPTRALYVCRPQISKSAPPDRPPISHRRRRTCVVKVSRRTFYLDFYLAFARDRRITLYIMYVNPDASLETRVDP